MSVKEIPGRPGVYEVRVPIPGQRNKERTAVVIGLRKAEAKERDMKQQLATGGLASPSDRQTTVTEFLTKIILAKVMLSPNTRRGYLASIRLHIEPSIGHIKVSTLGTQKLLLTGLFEQVQRTSGRAARRRVEQLVRDMLKIAIDEGILFRDPLARTKWAQPILARGPVYLPLTTDLVRVRKSIAGVTRAPSGSPLMATAQVDVLAGTGVRGGELMGFSDEDVDFENGLVTVSRQVIYLAPCIEADGTEKPGGVVFAPPKTDDSGPRTIPVPQFVLAAFASTKLRNGLREVTLPWEEVDGPPVTQRLFFFSLGHHDGPTRPAQPLTLTDRLRRHGKKLGLPKPLHGHCYRHWYTTTLDAAGVPRIAIDYVTGHKTAQSVTSQYLHVTPEMLARVVPAMDAVWQSAQSSMREAI